MKATVALLVAMAAMLAFPAWPKGGSGGTQHVDSYTRRDGTHVRAYNRRGPTGSADSGGSSAGYYTGDAPPPNTDAHGWSRDVDVSAATYPGMKREVTRIQIDEAPPAPTYVPQPAYASNRSRATSFRPSPNPRPITREGTHYKPAGIVERDSRGRIKRSESAKRDFQLRNPCPATGRSTGPCPGYVIDHIQPLKRGGADAPSNMQWQTVREAKEKDRWE
jgi:hypothetical protein